MRDGATTTSHNQLCRVGALATIQKREKSVRETSTPILPNFPGNKGNIIQYAYYLQVKTWHDAKHTPESDYSVELVAVLEGLKWKHTTSQGQDPVETSQLLRSVRLWFFYAFYFTRALLQPHITHTIARLF